MAIQSEAGPKIPIILQARVTCPHCWHGFPPDQALWISQHPDLIGDQRLGKDQQCRFLPMRFNIDGAAIDERGFTCHELACPQCHLPVPRALFEMEPFFLSILGAPASGKSYFLASMTWQLRKILPKFFGLGFGDADAASNHRLQQYEGLHFLNPDQAALVAIEKTETHGDLYDTVLFGDQAVSYLRPFLFYLTPLTAHPNFNKAAAVSRVICLYDNAGESFLPGHDTATNPVTRHLAHSRALMFLFDPSQDVRFRSACRGKTADPQMVDRSERSVREQPVRQETILLETAQRVRRYAGLGQNAKHSRPLIVVVTKYDCWSTLLNGKVLESPWATNTTASVSAMRLETIEGISQEIRALLWRLTPELVSAAESFAEHVLYIPVSATGCSPEQDAKTGALGMRPKNIRPQWVEVPLMYALARWSQGLIPYCKPTPKTAGSRSPPPPPPGKGSGAKGSAVDSALAPNGRNISAPGRGG